MKLTDAQVKRLRALESARGELKPSVVVNDARKRTSPLHTLFQWNLKRAAELYWTQRAREIIGAVEIMVTTTQATIKAPMYVRDPSATGEGYMNVTALRNDPVNARESLIYTLETAAGHLRRAYDLAQPLGLQHDVDQLLQNVVGVQRLIREAA